MADLWVGAGQRFTELNAAVAAARSGDTIHLEAGVYENDFASIYKDLRIVGEGGMAHLKATAPIGNGKAILVTNADVVLENIELSGARVADRNGAGVRFEGGSLTLDNTYFHHNENGVLAASAPGGRISIVDSEFAHNGRGDGGTHGVYVNKIAELTVRDSHFHDTDLGHHLKSRALSTEVSGTTFDDGALDSGYAVDLPNGGAAVLMGNTLIQGAAAGNKYMVHYGGETANPNPGSLVVAGNDFVNYRAGGATAVLNHTDRTADIRDNDFVDVADIVDGPARLAGNLLGLELEDLELELAGALDVEEAAPTPTPALDTETDAAAAPLDAAGAPLPVPDGFAELRALYDEDGGAAAVPSAADAGPLSNGRLGADGLLA